MSNLPNKLTSADSQLLSSFFVLDSRHVFSYLVNVIINLSVSTDNEIAEDFDGTNYMIFAYTFGTVDQ